MKKELVAGLAVVFVSYAFWTSCREPGAGEPGTKIVVKADKLRPKPGETVRITASVEPRGAAGIDGVLFVPTKGPRELVFRPAGGSGAYEADVTLAADAPQGFYGITTVARGGRRKDISPGKASFILGKAVGDFLITSALPASGAAEDAADSMKSFLGVGGNLLIVHDNINKKAWYPSKICASAADPGSADDRVGAVLDLADRLGFPVLITAVWDMTRPMPYSECMASMKAVMSELWDLYGSHPSLIGFYDYQEGSGTYFAAHVREFADAVKALNPGLLSGCAPYVDDPLLAGYLAAIDSLDIAIYQGAVMASFRPDNRKCFPIRRTGDFAALSAGAMLQKGKIALSHVELFGYLERAFGGAYLASPEDAYGQILSAASRFGPDGITLFTYHYNVHEMGKTVAAVKETAPAVDRGLKSFSLIAGEVATEPPHLAVYIPYNDWWVDRWTECFLPALDAFRRLGVPAGIVPFVPPRGEEILPFYPYHRNDEQVETLLREKTILVLPDVAGMQDTDSLMLKAFVERGGTVLLFGPRIPFGDGFKRDELVGAKERAAVRHGLVEVRDPLGPRVGRGERIRLAGPSSVSWDPVTAKAAAVFEDGSASVLVNPLGRGAVISVPLSLADASVALPDLIRDILDFALGRNGLKRPFDIEGVDGDMDVAVSEGNGTPALAVTSYRPEPVDIAVTALGLEPERKYVLADLTTGRRVVRLGRELSPWRVKVPPHGFIAYRITPE